MYVELQENNNRKIYYSIPNWLFDDGSQVTEEWLIENHNFYKVIDISENEPSDEFVLDNVDNWVVDETNKTITKTGTFIKHIRPEFNSNLFGEVVLSTTNNIDETHKEKIFELQYFSIEQIKSNLKNLAKQKRKQQESSLHELDINGKLIKTDITDTTRTAVIGMYLKSQLDPTITITYKSDDGNFFELNANDIALFSDLLVEKINSVFVNEKKVNDQIDLISDEDENKYELLKEIYNSTKY